MNGRDDSLDMMKGCLTVLMVLSHLTYVVPFDGIGKFNAYVNLTTFSGFMFCFGYVCWKAYIENEREDVVRRLLKGACKCVCAFYICGLGYYMRGTMLEWGGVILLQKIPTLTEFLLSFFLMYLMILILRRQLKKLSLTGGVVISVISWVFLSVFPFEIIINPVMGSIIGTTTYCSFPLMAYISYFLTGCLLAKYRVVFNRWLLLLTCIFTGIFFFFYRVNGILPGRFPPTVYWILGGSLFIYGYYCIFKLISRKGKKVKILVYVGKHTLVFLVVSNLLIFSLWNQLIDEEIWKTVSMNRWDCRYIIYAAITFMLSFIVINIKNIMRRAM